MTDIDDALLDALSFEVGSLEDVRALVEQTVWGTHGGLRYRNHSTDWSLLAQALIYVVKHAGQVVAATACIPQVWGYYLAMAAVQRDYQGRGVAKALATYAGSQLLPQLSEGQIAAACVVDDNLIAVNGAASLGLKAGARIESIVYGRRSPRAAPQCRGLRPDELGLAVRALEGVGRQWQDARASLRVEQCHVYEEGGRVVAGVQACPQQWELLHMALPLPEVLRRPLRRVVIGDEDALRFVQLHHLWGEPRCFDALFSHVLHAHGVRFASIQLDVLDPLYNAVRHCLPLGLASRLVGVQSMSLVSLSELPRPISVAPVMGTIA